MSTWSIYWLTTLYEGDRDTLNTSYYELSIQLHFLSLWIRMKQVFSIQLPLPPNLYRVKSLLVGLNFFPWSVICIACITGGNFWWRAMCINLQSVLKIFSWWLLVCWVFWRRSLWKAREILKGWHASPRLEAFPEHIPHVSFSHGVLLSFLFCHPSLPGCRC